MEYKILEADTLQGLESAVYALIQEGWYPQGGVAVAPETLDFSAFYVQAMARKE